MFLLPYETTVATKLYKNMEPLHSKIRVAKLNLEFPPMNYINGKTFKNQYFVTPHEEHLEIPSFTQYINIGTTENPEFLLDARAYMKLNKHTGAVKVISDVDWQLQTIRMALNTKESREGSGFYLGLGNVPIITFSRWISGILTARYNLTIESQMAISVICTLYYLAMINPGLRVASEARELELIKISQITGVDPDFSANVINYIENLANLDDLCYSLSNHSMQQRTGELKVQDLVMLLSSSWFGINSRENVAISLEHLPTFNALVYMALNTSLYRRMTLAQRAMAAGRDRDQKSFMEMIFRIINDYLEV